MKISEKAKKLIEGRTVVLGTVGDLGPNVTPVAACKVIDDKIIVTNNYLGSTLENILKNPNIAVGVWDDSNLDEAYGFKFYGKAEYHADGKWLDFVQGLEENEGMPSKGAIVFTSEYIKEI
ncbi:MAG: hypothetical protein UT66_C0009G0005 [candidate division CPR2 bacterium GW2011_GWC1_39_9]|uniref:Pyridoxamine 5'-phosphate oxidase N-terminal domain-containing protein n=1 Tax=candidate division CPR2 bacterium GW2011_GWC2_39_10 TaxID=1618345 RepID=A0A0G0LSY8_UNCC2|nr:MAG: hypothetical protein UT18_C0004G0010 [candidate division CPR2 bacterium GW2011_GWC2_39_10]KKR35642.1 MAG: hypothetical protein UT66_C0009G0005 [candidate division CPR2 bacterium GW2011_GWC1_39_9]